MYQIVSKLIYMPKICIGNMRHALILFIKSLPVDIFCICKDWWKTYLSRTKYNNRFPVYLDDCMNMIPLGDVGKYLT